MPRVVAFLFAAFTLAAFFVIPAAHAQDAENMKIPDMPAPIAHLAAEGAQVRYLGRELGMDGWITIKSGQEQYFYVTPDGKAIILGMLFNEDGKLVTARQLAALQGDDSELLDVLAQDPAPAPANMAQEKELRTPAERLMADVEDSNWVRIGDRNAPPIYVFIDPQCPHCHAFMDDLGSAGYIENGRIQVRMIPVGFRDETLAQAAFLLASPNPEERWLKHMQGDVTALPAKSGISTQGVQKNLGIMQSWKLDATPITVYRNAEGQIKIIRGRANNIQTLYEDLT